MKLGDKVRSLVFGGVGEVLERPATFAGYELPGQIRVSDGERGEGWTIVGPEEHFEIVDGSP